LIGNELFVEEFGSQSPGEHAQLVYKADQKFPVDIFQSAKSGDALGPKYFFFQLSDPKKHKWVSTPENLFLTIKPLQLISNDLLLFQGSTPTWTASYLLNLKNGKVSPLGSGSAEYIGDGHFILHGYKGYARKDRDDPLGAYWADVLVDKEGAIIKFLSKGNVCYPLRYLINTEDEHPKLVQGLDQKICVEQ